MGSEAKNGRWRRLVAFLALTASLPITVTGAAEQAQPAALPDPVLTRELHVPFETLAALISGNADHILMPRSEYDELVVKARRTAETAPPKAALLNSADYRLQVGDERAIVTGKIGIATLTDGVHALPFEIAGIALRTAVLSDRPAPLARGEDGRLTLFLSGRGQHTLAMEATAPLQTSAARQVLDFALPTPPGTRLNLTVPGDVEVKSGAAVISRTWDEQAEETRFEILPSRGRITLVMTLNSRLKRKDRVVVARSVLVDEMTQAYERLHANVSLDILHRAVDTFRFSVPSGFEVTAVEAPEVARWAVATEEGKTFLDVFLREEVTGTVVLGLSALRTQPPLDKWRLERFEPQGVVAQVAVTGLLLETRLKVEAMQPKGLMAIDNAILVKALPPTAQSDDPGRPDLRPVVAFYAPSGDFELNGRFARPRAEMRVTTNLLLTVRRGGLHLRGGLAVLAQHEKLFSVDITTPPNWDVTGVTNAEGQALSFERYDAGSGAGRLQVRLPNGVAPGQQQTVIFEAVHVPTGWLGDWQVEELRFPAFTVQNAARDTGALAVNTEDDLRARATQLDGLTPLNENEKSRYGLAGVSTGLAYRYESPPYAATLAIDRLQPRKTAETFSFFRVEEDVLHAHFELVYDVVEAREEQLALLLPKDTPASIAIRGLQETAVKESTSEVAGEYRRWLVRLAQPAAGALRLAVDFQQPLADSQHTELVLPVVRADGVDYESGFVAVEGSAELDVRISGQPRKVDIGEMVEAEYQPGPRLLGAYSFLGTPPPIAVSVVRPRSYPLPAAIIQRTEVTTVVSAEGRAQSQAEFELRTKAIYLRVRLPGESELWAVTLDDRPLSPQREQDYVLIDVPAGPAGQVRRLVLVYETPVTDLFMLSGLDLPAPELVFHETDSGAGVPVPVTDLSWRLYLPTGYDVLHSNGTVVATHVERPGLAAVNLVRWLYRAGGGIRFKRGLLGGCVAALGQARHLAAPLSKTGGEYEVVANKDIRYEEMAEAAGPPPPDAVGRRDAEQLPQSEVTAQPTPEPEPGETPPAANAPVPGTERTPPAKQRPVWAVEGMRSLDIQLRSNQPWIDFRSLGEGPLLQVLLASRKRLGAMALAAAALVIVGGMALTGAGRGKKVAYLVMILAGTTVLPVVPSLVSLARMFNAAFYGACLLIPYYFLAGLSRRAIAAERKRREAKMQRLLAMASRAVLIAVLLTLGIARAQETPARGRGVDSTSVVVDGEPVLAPIVIPPDAVIVPYRLADEGPAEADLVLIHRTRFEQLWRTIHAQAADPDADAAPAPFALAGMTLRGKLTDMDDLTLEGRLEIEVFGDDPVDVPLPFHGMVIADAALDGQPARLRILQSERLNAENQFEQQQRPVPEAKSVLALAIWGRGRHVLDFTVRLKLSRQGGWRVATGTLPAVAATSLDLTVPEAGTTVRLGPVADRQIWEGVAAGTVIRTTLPATGEIACQWRGRITEGQVDPSLTADSKATFDVLEDRLQMTWEFNLAFRHGEREFFTVELPPGYLVEKVDGTNVRGWEVSQDVARPRLDIALLKEAKGSETFKVVVWQAQTPGRAGPVVVETPVLNIAGAIRHTGRVVLRHSPALDVRMSDSGNVRRVDMGSLDEAPNVTSPLGVRPLQQYEFVTVPFVLKVRVAAAKPSLSAALQTILRIGEREREVESRAVLRVNDRPVHRLRLRLPADLNIGRVSAPGLFEWGTSDEPDAQILTVYFANGLTGEVPVVVSGRLGEIGRVDSLSLPHFWIEDVERQTGDIVVQIDPQYDVRAEALENVRTVLMKQVYSWLSGDQRNLARLALRYDQPDYSGRLVTSPRSPDVRCYTVTNARVTDRAVEETTLLYFTIYQAGIQEVRFKLAPRLAGARIRVPLLRQKTVEQLPDGSGIAVRLELQDQVMNQLRVLVEHDRLLTGDNHEITAPHVQTGRIERQYISVESAGRDEVVIDTREGLEPLTRQQKDWRVVESLFEGGSTRAFVTTAGPDTARLLFRTKQRLAVETAGARIGLATCVVAVDDGGAYRAIQTFNVDNRTEQFLDIDLPEGAYLFTVRVAGQLVKPVLPDPSAPSNVQIPLVKTAAGDLDYLVVLKYGGIMEVPNPLTPTGFPLPSTRNINVEQSQVELWLPGTRQWFDFGGTMRQVRRAGAFEAGYLAYQNKLAKRLLDTLRFGSAFEKARATSNLKQMGQAMELARKFDLYDANADLQNEIKQAQVLLRQSNEQLTQSESEKSAVVPDNRRRMNTEFDGQYNGLARNQVMEAGPNWGDADIRRNARSNTVTTFDGSWLEARKLDTSEEAEKDDLQRARERGQKLVSKPQVKAQLEKQMKEMAEVRDEAPQAVDFKFKGGKGKQGKKVEWSARQSDAKSRALQYQQRLEQNTQLQFDQNAVINAGDVGVASQDTDARMLGSLANMTTSGVVFQTAVESPIGGVQGGQMVELFSRADIGGLASLDVDLPAFDESRWRRYRFTTPRGEVTVTARAVARSAWLAAERIGVAAIAVVLILCGRWVTGPRPTDRRRRSTTARWVAAIGFVGLLAGVFPLYSAMAFVVGLTWWLVASAAAFLTPRA